jgi:hypothetical protein
MNHEQITNLALEAGLFVPPSGIPEDGALMRFAAGIAEIERRRIAKVCWDSGLACEVRQGADICFDLSEAIRARENT